VTTYGGLLDDRQDPEGWWLGITPGSNWGPNITADEARELAIERAQAFDRLWAERAVAREAALGYVVQPATWEGLGGRIVTNDGGASFEASDDGSRRATLG